jgi:hypothetical protein
LNGEYTGEKDAILMVLLSNETGQVQPFVIQNEVFVAGQLLVSFDPTSYWQVNSYVPVIQWPSVTGSFQLIQAVNLVVDFVPHFESSQTGRCK